MQNIFNEAFQAMSMLEHEDFALSTTDTDALTDFLQDEDSIEDDNSVTIYDKDADTEDEIETSYVGKIIGQCTNCQALSYFDEDEIEFDENSDTINKDTECPNCHATQGFSIIGKVEDYDVEDDKFEDDLNLDDDEEETADIDSFADEDSEEDDKSIAESVEHSRRLTRGARLVESSQSRPRRRFKRHAKNESLAGAAVGAMAGATIGHPIKGAILGASVSDLFDKSKNTTNEDYDYDINEITTQENPEEVFKRDDRPIEKIVEPFMPEPTYIAFGKDKDYLIGAYTWEHARSMLADKIGAENVKGYDIVSLYESNNEDVENPNEDDNTEELNEAVPVVTGIKFIASHWKDILAGLEALGIAGDTIAEVYARIKEASTVTEGLSNVTINSNDTQIDVSTDENGDAQVNISDNGTDSVSDEPFEDEVVSDEETIQPLTDEEKSELEDEASEEDAENNEDSEEYDIDEDSFEKVGESFLKECYSNVKSFKLLKISGNLAEGVATLNDGTKGKIAFNLTGRTYPTGKSKLFIESKQIANKRISIRGTVKDKKFISEKYTAFDKRR